MSSGSARARVYLRRGRLVLAPDGETGQLAGDGAPRIALRNGKLVDLRAGSLAPVDVATDAANADPPALKPVGKPTGRLEAALIAIFVFTLLFPVSWSLGPLRITPYLLLLAIGFLPLLGMWMAHSRTPVTLPDLMILAFCCWSTVALGINGGWSASVEPIGVQWLTTLGAYLAGRLLVRDARSLKWLVLLMAIISVVLLPLLILEMVTRAKPLLEVASLFGRPLDALHIGQRFGLERAQGPFEHPIAAGIFMASMFSPLVYIVGGKSLFKRTLIGFISGFAAVCSISTAALLSLNVQLGLMLWSRVLRSIRHRWRVLTGLLVSTYVAIDLVTVATPFHVFVRYATFSQGSSYNRILIWQFGSAEAMRHPFFGIGLGEWTRPTWMSSSMDNFWLVVTVRYGIPAFLLLASAIILTMWRIGKVNYGSQLTIIRRAMMFSLIGTIVTVCSAHLWNASYVWFMFFVGASSWLALRPKVDTDTPSRRTATLRAR